MYVHCSKFELPVIFKRRKLLHGTLDHFEILM
uniref:Uncharacterized protein n=1 Tax=Amphimedon queenslandica TaxID=400682 RepID=A0A1X7UWQ1_AMPQE